MMATHITAATIDAVRARILQHLRAINALRVLLLRSVTSPERETRRCLGPGSELYPEAIPAACVRYFESQKLVADVGLLPPMNAICIELATLENKYSALVRQLEPEALPVSESKHQSQTG
jgi:hypothetical protein